MGVGGEMQNEVRRPRICDGFRHIRLPVGNGIVGVSSAARQRYRANPVAVFFIAIAEHIQQKRPDKAGSPGKQKRFIPQPSPIVWKLRNGSDIFPFQIRHLHFPYSRLRYALNSSRSSRVVSLIFFSEPAAKCSATPSSTIIVLVYEEP